MDFIPEYEYVLFKITDIIKFQEFMTTYLSMLADNSHLGYQVQILGYGKEPFEQEAYLDYLHEVRAVDDMHELYLNFDEWKKLDCPKEESEELHDRIAKELCN